MDIQAAEVIQILQSLGMSLKEISAINEERRNGELTCVRSLEITKARLMRLEAKATELEMMMVCISNNAAFGTAWDGRGHGQLLPPLAGNPTVIDDDPVCASSERPQAVPHCEITLVT